MKTNMKNIIFCSAVTIAAGVCLGFMLNGDSPFVEQESNYHINVNDNYSRLFEGTNADYDENGLFYRVNLSTEKACVSMGKCTSTTVIVPDSFAYGGKDYQVTALDYSAFANYTSLTSVSIPNTINLIDSQAFGNTRSLTSLIVRNYSGTTSSPPGEITIPEGITEIEESTFMFCTSATKFKLPSTLITVKDNAFNSCISVNSAFGFASSVREIGYSAFAYCENLPRVTLNKGITTIGDYAFYKCKNLRFIFVPKSITSMGNYVFRGCYSGASTYMELSETDYTNSEMYKANPTWRYVYNTGTNDIYLNLQYGFANVLLSDDGLYLYTYIDTSNANVDLRYEITIIKYLGTTLSNVDIPDTFPIDDAKSAYGRTLVLDINSFVNRSEISTLTLPAYLTDINIYAFYGCTGLTSITFNDTLERIGEYAFSNTATADANAITSNVNTITLTFPSSLKTIGTGAFLGYTKAIVDFTNASSLTSIGENAFYNLNIQGNSYSLVFPVPNTELTIMKNAFGCGKFSSISFNSNTNTSSKVIISEYAFNNCSSVTYISLSKNITSIGNYAFSINTSSNSVLSYVYLPVTNNKITLSNLIFSNHYKAVLYTAFADANHNFTYTPGDNDSGINNANSNLVLSKDTLTNGSGYELSYTRGGTTISVFKVQNMLITYSISSFEDGVYTYNGQYRYVKANSGTEIWITQYLSGTNITIPDTLESLPVTTICNYAFFNTSITKVTTGTTNLKTIGTAAFANCKSLNLFTTGSTSVSDFASSITSIGKYAFFQSIINYVSIGENVSYLGETDYTQRYYDSSGDTTAKNIITAFKYCDKITSFQINPGNTTYVGTDSVTINSVTFYPPVIYKKNVDNTTYTLLTSFGMYLNSKSSTTSWFTTTTYTYLIKDNTTAIYDYAFVNTLFVYLEAPSTLESIGAAAFAGVESDINGFSYNGTKLKSFKLTNRSTSKLAHLGNFSFYGATSMTTFDLPIKIDTEDEANPFLGSYCLRGCKTLPSLYLPSGLKIVPGFMFDQCDSIATVVIPDTVTIIGTVAFWGCKALTKIAPTEAELSNISTGTIKLPKELLELGKRYGNHTGEVFTGCTKINYVDLQSSAITVINFETFKNCSNLIAVYNFPTSVTSINSNAFLSCSSLKGLTTGTRATSTIKIPSAITMIDTSAFQSCSSITNLNFSSASNLVTINNNSFRSCSSISTITFKDASKLNAINDSAFMSCTSIKSISFSGVTSLKNINLNAFSGCTSLATADFTGATSLIAIRQSAFQGDTALYSIKFSSANANFNLIGISAFSGCTNSNFTVVDLSACSKLSKISSNAFEKCAYLTTFIFPTSTTALTLEPNAFNGCTRLNRTSADTANYFYIPEKVKLLNNNLFKNCTALVHVVVLNKDIKMNNTIFSGCTSLSRVYLKSTLNQYTTLKDNNSISTSWFDGTPSSAKMVFYSEGTPDVAGYIYWHYVNNVITEY